MEKQHSRRVGTAITLACCAAATIAMLAVFSRPYHHEKTDALFKQLIDFFVELWNTMPWGIVILAGALIVPLLGLLALPFWDILTRRAPAGSFLFDNVGLSFENRAGLRFVPSFLTIIYFIIAAFMKGADSSMSFDPPGYFPFTQSYSAGEWLNFVFVTLMLFSLFLVIAEGVISAGPWGMLIHIPVIIAANIYLIVLMTAIMFVAVTLFGFIGKIIMSAIALTFVGGISAVAQRNVPKVRYIERK